MFAKKTSKYVYFVRSDELWAISISIHLETEAVPVQPNAPCPMTSEPGLHSIETRSYEQQITFLAKVFSYVKLLALKCQSKLLSYGLQCQELSQS